MVAVSLKKKNFFQAEDGIRDVERSRGLGDVYKRQAERTADESNVKDGNTIRILSPIFGVSIPVIILLTMAFYFKKRKKPKAETDRDEGTMQNLV